MPLADFIESEIDRLVDEWEKFAGTKLPQAEGMSSSALRDEARNLLLHIAADMRAARSAEEQLEKSQGKQPGNAPALTDKARRHARNRLSQGFTLDQMVSEYRALRASVMLLWTGQRAGSDPEALADLVRFDEALDQALTESVAWYSGRLEDSRNLLLGVLSHDLRNPLGAASSSASYLLRLDGLDGAQTKAVLRILNSTSRMQRMVNDLLDFTRTRLGRGLPIRPAPVNLREVCFQTVDELEAFHPDRALRFQCSGDLSGRWDAPRIAQLLSNLTANAIQHGDPGKPVTITARGEDDGVVLEVHNEGPAIALEAQRAIFEPMMRAVVQEAERREGSASLGLGLYIARQIAVAHGGSIEVVSSERNGTTFTARLPRGPRASDESTAGMS